MNPTIRLFIKKTEVGVQKINGIILEIYRIVLAAFSINNQANRVKFFEKTFLMANISLEVVFRIFFFILIGVNVNIKQVKLGGKNKFPDTAFDPEYKTFVVNVTSLTSSDLDIYLFYRPQVAGLISKKVSTIILAMKILIASMVIITILIPKSKMVIIAMTNLLLPNKLKNI